MIVFNMRQLFLQRSLAGQPLLILGASARAAAQSAHRAGLLPVAGDLFADEDLRACCPAVRCDDYPDALETIARATPPSPWMATGGLENFPDLIDRISQERHFYGNRGDVMRRAGDPFQLATLFKEAGIAFPAVCRDASRIPTDGSWLQKPLNGCGGLGIRRWTIENAAVEDTAVKDTAIDPARYYFQQRIEGIAISAVYLAAAGTAQLLGATWQLVGRPWTGASGFQYAGSIGLLQTQAGLQSQLVRLGDTLSHNFQLTGLFGIDAILAGETVWPVEVNPRLPASVEILERVLGFSAVGLHVVACRDALLPDPSACTTDEMAKAALHGKAVLYSRCDFVVEDRFLERIRQRNHGTDDPVIADIPTVGTHILAGHPLMTVFATGADRGIVKQRLRELAAEFLSE